MAQRKSSPCPNSVVVLPTRPDPNSLWSSPLKFFEYMACGYVIVGADLPPLHEMLGENEAAWVKLGVPETPASALRRITTKKRGSWEISCGNG